MFICVSHQLWLLENLNELWREISEEPQLLVCVQTSTPQWTYNNKYIHNYTFNQKYWNVVTPSEFICHMTLTWSHKKTISSTSLPKSNKVLQLSNTSILYIFDYKSTWMYKVNIQVLVLTDFKMASSWCLMGTSSYSAALEMISKRPLIFVLLFRDRLKVSVKKKKQPLVSVSSTPCSKVTYFSLLFIKHQFSWILFLNQPSMKLTQLNVQWCKHWFYLIYPQIYASTNY